MQRLQNNKSNTTRFKNCPENSYKEHYNKSRGIPCLVLKSLIFPTETVSSPSSFQSSTTLVLKNLCSLINGAFRFPGDFVTCRHNPLLLASWKISKMVLLPYWSSFCVSLLNLLCVFFWPILSARLFLVSLRRLCQCSETSDHSCCSFLHFLTGTCPFAYIWNPHLNTILQVRSDQ